MTGDKLKTLLIDANGMGWEAFLKDSVLRGLLNIPFDYTSNTASPPFRMMHKYLHFRNDSLSYVLDWRDAFCEMTQLDIRICNMTNLIDYFRCLRAIKDYPLVVILHSVTGDSMSVLLRTVEWFKKRRGKLVVFVGNEYSLLTEKLDFLRSVEADYVCSQLPIEVARWLYTDCTKSEIVAMPHALNPKLYSPDHRGGETIDIGFVGALYHNIIGDMERTNLIRFFEIHSTNLGVKCDLRTQRLPRNAWVQFLRNCKAILGAESGTYYLDRTGKIIEKVNNYIKKHPKASFEELHELYFKDIQSPPVSGKAISSRHFEPIGTKTCQILIEGYYNGILKADENYISVKKDLSNIWDVIQRFKDDSYRNSMVERTYELALASHTYKHRVEALLKIILGSSI